MNSKKKEELIMNNLSLGDKIKFLRKKKGMTQKQLAEKIPVSFSTFRRWEKDKHNPDAKDIIRLAELLDTTTSYLMEDKKILNPPEDFDIQYQKILNLARDIANDDIELKESVTAGSTQNMFIIYDNNTNTEFRIPNNPDGRKLFIDFLKISMNPLFSKNTSKTNVITGDNNNGNTLIND